MKKLLAATTALAATAAGTTLLVAGPANADVERNATCGGAMYQLNVDRERGGFEVDVDVEGAQAFSTWTLTLRHDGAVAAQRTLKADDEGDVDLGVYRKNTAGKDVFKATVKPASGKACSTSVTVR